MLAGRRGSPFGSGSDDEEEEAEEEEVEEGAKVEEEGDLACPAAAVAVLALAAPDRVLLVHMHALLWRLRAQRQGPRPGSPGGRAGEEGGAVAAAAASESVDSRWYVAGQLSPLLRLLCDPGTTFVAFAEGRGEELRQRLSRALLPPASDSFVLRAPMELVDVSQVGGWGLPGGRLPGGGLRWWLS